MAGCSRQGDDADTIDSLSPPILVPISVNVTLSAEAQEQIASGRDTVRVEAIYSGTPKADAKTRVNQLGFIELGTAQRELKGSGKIIFSTDAIDKSRLGMIEGQPQVMINVVSGGDTAEDKKLACKFFWDTLEVAGRSEIQVPCKLKSEVATPADLDFPN